MKKYKSVFNLLALVIVLVFFAWMFSTAAPEKPWKPKQSMKRQTMVVELKTPMNIEEVRYDK